MPIYMQAQPEGADIPVYNIRPLLEATERLFGRAKERRFLYFRELTYREVVEKLWHAVLYGYGL